MPPIPLLQDLFYYPPIYAWVFQVVSSPKPCMHLSSVRATRLTHPIILYLITRMIFGEEYRAQSSFPCSLLHCPVTCHYSALCNITCNMRNLMLITFIDEVREVKRDSAVNSTAKSHWLILLA